MLGSLLSIEVKSSETVKQDDFPGAACPCVRDGRLSRGFVIYTGSQVIKGRSPMGDSHIGALWRMERSCLMRMDRFWETR